MQPEFGPPEELLELVGDEYTRRVLSAVAEQPRSGPTIAERTDVSKATVYRRLDRLEDANLVASTWDLDSDGNHSRQYRAVVSGVDFELGQDGIVASVRTDEQPTAGGAARPVADD